MKKHFILKFVVLNLFIVSHNANAFVGNLGMGEGKHERSVSSSDGRNNDTGSGGEVRYYNTDHSDHYTFSSKYHDLTPLMLSRYQFIVYINQLDSIESTLTPSLHQILDIRNNPVNMKNKKWSNKELDLIIEDCLKKGESK